MRPKDCLFNAEGNINLIQDAICEINKSLRVWGLTEYWKYIEVSRSEKIRKSLIKYYTNCGWEVSEAYGDLCHPDTSPYMLIFTNPHLKLEPTT